MIRFGIKVGLAAGAVYYLNDQGLWKESQESTKIYGKMYTSLCPYFKQAKSQIPIELPELPKPESIPNTVANYWNKGVKLTISFVSDVPNKSVNLIGKGITMLKDNNDIKSIIGINSHDDVKSEKLK